jgi:hypothetical protein
VQDINLGVASCPALDLRIAERARLTGSQSMLELEPDTWTALLDSSGAPDLAKNYLMELVYKTMTINSCPHAGSPRGKRARSSSPDSGRRSAAETASQVRFSCAQWAQSIHSSVSGYLQMSDGSGSGAASSGVKAQRDDSTAPSDSYPSDPEPGHSESGTGASEDDAPPPSDGSRGDAEPGNAPIPLRRQNAYAAPADSPPVAVFPPTRSHTM